jgi:flagellar motility protein MotE (MotC chaperone)
MSTAPSLRLMPAVLICGLALLAVKGIGLVRDARADAQGNVQIAAAQPAAPGENGTRQKDIAGDETETASAAEVDVLSSLARRRAELDARARDQDMRENVLAATERRIDAKIAALRQLQGQINQLLGQRDAAQEKQTASLVKTYSDMKPRDAARIFNGLSDDVLIDVAGRMKSDALAPVLAAMNAEAAQKLTLRLASRFDVPEKASLVPPAAVVAGSAAPVMMPAQPAAPMAAPQMPAPTTATSPAPVSQTAPATHG